MISCADKKETVKVKKFRMWIHKCPRGKKEILDARDLQITSYIVHRTLRDATTPYTNRYAQA